MTSEEHKETVRHIFQAAGELLVAELIGRGASDDEIRERLGRFQESVSAELDRLAAQGTA